jgi:hypothetical protein
MRFCAWYPLDDAGRHAPPAPGVFQVRVPQEAGLLRYPTGQSAMIHYQLADDVHAAAVRFAEEHAGRGWLCRHTIEMTERDDLPVFHARLVRDFATRFGAEPGAQA